MEAYPHGAAPLKEEEEEEWIYEEVEIEEQLEEVEEGDSEEEDDNGQPQFHREYSSAINANGDFILSSYFSIRGEEKTLDASLTIRLLQQLRAEITNRALKNFIISDQQIWTSDLIADRVAQLFRYSSYSPCTRSNQQWDVGLFAKAPPANAAAFHSVVESAIMTKRFKKLYLGTQDARSEHYSRTLSMIFRNMSSIPTLHLTDFLISEIASQALAQSLITPLSQHQQKTTKQQNKQQELLQGPTHLEFRGCRFGDALGFTDSADDNFEMNPALAMLGTGLMGNQTLQVFSIFGCHEDDWDDGNLAIVIRGLIQHPSLQLLELKDHEFGRESMRALGRVLRSCPSLTQLSLSNHSSCTRQLLDVPRLVTIDDGETIRNHLRLSSSSSFSSSVLEVLDLSKNEMRDSAANYLLRVLSLPASQEQSMNGGNTTKMGFPNLHTLNLAGNQLKSWAILTNGLLGGGGVSAEEVLEEWEQRTPAAPFSSRLRTLILDDNVALRDSTLSGLVGRSAAVITALESLLSAFPRLGSLGEDFMLAFFCLPNIANKERTLLSTRRALPLQKQLALQFDWRRCGGEYVLRVPSSSAAAAQQEGEIPLALWPLVLLRPFRDRYLSVPKKLRRYEGCDDNYEKLLVLRERQATIVFQLLQGPALLGRASYC